MEKYEILKDLISFDTIKDKQNKEIIEYIENVLINKGFKTEYKGKYLIMTTEKEPALGFLGHTDTVEYIEGWDSNPFELTKKDNKLYGLGVCDMKGGIAAMLDAINEINLSELKQGIKLYFTYDEEISFGGILDIIKANENFPETMIFGEPTDNEVLVGSKGMIELKLFFKGIKAHSSNPARGKSANMNAIKFLYELEDFYNEKIKKDIKEIYEIPYTTMNVGIIKGGSAVNSVSASCEAIVDFRIIESKHIELIKEKVEELKNKYDCEVAMQHIVPFYNEIDFVEKPKTANFLTEASFLNSGNRIILGLGPVTAHEVNEHITEESYEKLVQQYKDIIKRTCM